MAVCHTDYPEPHGERELAKRLVAFPDETLHLWFDVGYLPGVPQIDLFAVHERAGAFVIEVKAIPMAAIEWQDFERLKVRGRPEGHSAQRQAFLAFEGLRTFLHGVGRKTDFPFITSTACFPLITRSEWNAACPDTRLTGPYAERLIFADDLGEAESFAGRLATIWMNPPRGRGFGRPFTFVPAQFERIVRHLHVRTRAERIASDQARLHELERTQRQAADNDAPVGSRSRIAYTGYPGTGKTFRLMRIAIQHAIAGKRALFLCFNKVLAADFRRLLTASQAEDRVEAWDLFDFLRSVREAKGVDMGEMDGAYDNWATETVAMIDRDPIAAYDTVLVDEAQDLQPWAITLIRRLTTEESTICVALGSGQELYGHEVDVTVELGLHEKKLRRVFRNRPGIFRFAQAVFESGLQGERIESATRRFRHDAGLQAEFDKDDDELPRIVVVNDDAVQRLDERGRFYPEEREELEAALVKTVIDGEIASLVQGEARFDILVLVPSGRDHLCRAVRAALAMSGIPVTDYVSAENRRNVARADAVRLCTYHSARGIEGARVVVYGFTKLDDLANQAGVTPANLAYVALSRASRECTVVFAKSELSHPHAEVAMDISRRLAALNESRAWSGLDQVAEAAPPYGRGESVVYRTVLQLRTGDDVSHVRHGRGVVIAVDESALPAVAEVSFESGETTRVRCDEEGLRRV